MIRKTLLLLILWCTALPVFAQKTLTILYTNDIHSRIEPIPLESADSLSAGKGGLLRVAAYVEHVRKETPNVLVFDCGDFSQGTPYYNMYGGEIEMQLMNAIGYDAGTIGNHEFDLGMENMARIFKLANFPFICTNYDVAGTVLEGLVKPYTIIEKYGLKIGLLGVGTALAGMVQAECYEGVTVCDPYQAANRAAAELKRKGCDLIICLSHLGYTIEAINPMSDMELAKHTRNIDIVLGGHSHTFLDESVKQKNLDGKEVYITQMGKSGIFVGRMDVEIKTK